jgi:hypothetical protein
MVVKKKGKRGNPNSVPDSVVLDAAAGLKALTTGEALELDERGPRYPCFVQRRQGRIVDLCTEVGSRLRAD